MTNKKTLFISLVVFIIIISSFTFLFKDRLIFYFKTREFAEAAGGLPWQFGGTITVYQPVCTADNPSGTCPVSCPMCTGVLGLVCNGYQEIQFKPSGGTLPQTPFVCAPKGFQFIGGGTVPRVGGFILGGGMSNILPVVIGVSL